MVLLAWCAFAIFADLAVSLFGPFCSVLHILVWLFVDSFFLCLFVCCFCFALALVVVVVVVVILVVLVFVVVVVVLVLVLVAVVGFIVHVLCFC